MNTKKLTLMAMLTALALIIFILEAQLPPLFPIPGIKPGLANIITLLALLWLGKKEAFTILILRIFLGSVFTGNMASFIYSIAGGITAYIFTFIMLKSSKNIIASSILGALGHNLGQIITASLLSGITQIFYYFPFLVISGIITGLFTGVIAYFISKQIKPYGGAE